MNTRLVLVAVLAAGVWAVAPATVWADTKKCEVDSQSGQIECTLIATPGPPVAVPVSPDLPIEWSRVAYVVPEDTARGRGCVRTNADVLEIGVVWIITLTNTETGEVLLLDSVCEWPGEDPPTPPPPPPTPGQLAEDNAQALTLDATLSPDTGIGGLTGLESWLWCTDPGAVAADAELNGWVAAGSVQVVLIGWEVDGPTGTTANTSTCGSLDQPAVRWTPETMGDYSVAVTAAWAGTWELTYLGVPMGTYPLGPLYLTSEPVPYPVDEYRGVLTE